MVYITQNPGFNDRFGFNKPLKKILTVVVRNGHLTCQPQSWHLFLQKVRLINIDSSQISPFIFFLIFHFVMSLQVRASKVDSSISISQVKDLAEQTSAGIISCRQAAAKLNIYRTSFMRYCSRNQIPLQLSPHNKRKIISEDV
jgi:hypothetical protein